MITVTLRAPRRIRFGGRLDQPRHVAKLVNFDNFAA